MRFVLIGFFYFFSLFEVFAGPPDFVVAKDGSGDFKTVQEAIDAVPDSSAIRTVIYIKAGVYKEKLVLPVSKMNVTFWGQDVKEVILTYDDYASKKNAGGQSIGTTGSSSFFVYGSGFQASNITFENSAGPVGQAVAVRVSGDRAQFINCRFLGFQDTLYVQGPGAKSRQYYKNCYIEGTTDFIFGAATAVFENCTIHCKKGGTYITAASTPQDSDFWMVFLRCTLSGAPGVQYYLGRPWGDFARTVFIQCALPAFIRPEGWHNWGRPQAEKTTCYGEYKNRGEGSAAGQRVDWSHQLCPEQARRYTVSNIFKDWKVQ